MMALRTAATGMAAQDLNVDVISNNIANLNTVGYKKQRAEFEDLLYQTMESPGAQSSDTGTVVPTGVQIGGGVKAGSVYRITEQGANTSTGNGFADLLAGQMGWTEGRDLAAAASTDPACFAESVVSLYRDEALWQALRDNAIERLRAENSREQYADAVSRVLDGRIRRPGSPGLRALP